MPDEEFTGLDAAQDTTPTGLEDGAATQQDDRSQTAQPQGADEAPSWFTNWAGQNEQRITRLEESNRALIQSNSAYQGQVRALESRIAQQQQQSRREPTLQEHAQYLGLDPTDAVSLAYAKRDLDRQRQFDEQEARLQRLEQGQERQQYSAKELKFRTDTLEELAEKAEDLGVSFDAVRRHLEALPTDRLWGDGKTLLRQAAKEQKEGATRQTEGRGQGARQAQSPEEERIRRQAYEDAGVFQDQPRGGGSIGTGDPRRLIKLAAAGERVDLVELTKALDRLDRAR